MNMTEEGNVMLSDNSQSNGQNIHNETDKIENEKIDSIESSSLRQRLKKDKKFRNNFGVWLCLCISFHVLGWNLGISGPTLLDLQLISRCTLEEASLFFTFISAGYLVASFVISLTFDRFDKYLHIAVGNLGTAVVMTAIPWCFIYGAMLTMHFLKGFMCGISELAASTLLIHLMGQNVKTYMQILHFSYTIGGIISPMMSAPFLTQMNETSAIKNESSSRAIMNESSSRAIHATLFNISESNADVKSQVYIPFAVVGCLCLLPAMLFVILFIRCEKDSKTRSKEENKKQEDLPLRLYIPVIVTLLMLWFVAFSIEDSIASFIATYAVKHFKWTAATASYCTSVFWTSFAVGSFSGIFIATLVSVSKLLLFYSVILLVSTISLLVTSLYDIDAGLWVFSGITGVCLSLNFPLLFTWAEEDFIHVTAKVTAAMTVSASLGVIICPIIVGVLIEIRPVYFSFFLLANSACFIFLIIFGKLLSLNVKKYRNGKKVESETTKTDRDIVSEEIPLKSTDGSYD